MKRRLSMLLVGLVVGLVTAEKQPDHPAASLVLHGNLFRKNFVHAR